MNGGTILLGIDGGGTRTIALATTGALEELVRIEGGSANVRLLTEKALLARFRDLAARLPRTIAAVGAGLAGIRERVDATRVEAALRRVWRGAVCVASHDLETALRAAAGFAGPPPAGCAAEIVALSGTGSCCYGRNGAGLEAKVGGWGHLLGDRGSAYEISLTALREILVVWDRERRWPSLGSELLNALALHDPEQLVGWIQEAAKPEVAALTPVVFKAAAAGDAVARRVLESAAQRLADDALACAGRLAPADAPVRIHLAGGTLLNARTLAEALSAAVTRGRPNAVVAPLSREAAWGAALMAREALQGGSPDLAPTISAARGARGPLSRPVAATLPESVGPSPTESRNPRSAGLDRMSLAAAVDLMIREQESVDDALRRARRPLLKLTAAAARVLKNGGRLLYVGAGTSGRLGVLDAAECPPTFQSDPRQVQAIIAGGRPAITTAVEGAEDDLQGGAGAVDFHGVRSADLVIGIAASGRTPFVWGALGAARRRGAATAIVTCNPGLRFARAIRPDHIVTLDTGPEVLTGSTRLKAGSATKAALNIVTTLSFVRLGKVASNLMIDVRPSNAKLRARAARILAEIAQTTAEDAVVALQRHGWSIRAALRYRRPRPSRPRPPRKSA